MANKSGTRQLVGVIACLCCGRDIPVRQSDTGTLNVTCGWCEVTGHARRGTHAHALVMRRIKPGTAPAPEVPPHGPPPKPAPAAAAPAVPVPPPARAPASPFHI